MSKEEELRRERQRISADRIDKYLICRGERGKATFLISMDRVQHLLFLSPSDAEREKEKNLKDDDHDGDHDDGGQDNQMSWNIDTKSIQLSEGSAIIDAKMSPDGRWISFVRNGELWAQDTHFPDQQPLQISRSLAGRVSATAEYIIQEEFDRYTGYYWDPKVIVKEDGETIYRLVWQEYDESHVDVVSVGMDSFDDITEIEKAAYPRPGKQNVESFLCMGEIRSMAGEDSRVLSRRLKSSIKTTLPWSEYMVRFGFGGKDRLFVQILDRLQKRLETISLPINDDQFIPIDQNETMEPFFFETIHCETSETWVNVSDVLHFFSDGSNRIILSNESTGFRHLYLLSPDASGGWKTQQITSGAWQVEANDVLKVDEERQLVFFMGNRSSPLEKHLYCASFASSHLSHTVQFVFPPFLSSQSLHFDD